MKVPIARPFFDDAEKTAVLEPLESGWVMQGPKVAAFEAGVCEITDSRFARATSSGTAALHLALLACGVGPGDEVIVPAFTCVAGINPVEYVGAKPVFVDIDLDSYNLDLQRATDAFTSQTAAVIPAHLFGLCSELSALVEAAAGRGVLVIEDAALSFGSTCLEGSAGAQGHAGCFSFHPRKMITTAEGGMVVTDDEQVAEKAGRLRSYGAGVSAWQRHHGTFHALPEFDELGYNYKLSDLHASVGLAQLGKLPRIIEARRAIAHRYDQAFWNLGWLKLPRCPDGACHVYQSYVCLCDPAGAAADLTRLPDSRTHRDSFFAWLAEHEVAAVAGAQAVHLEPYYRNRYELRPEQFPNALVAGQLSVALPIFPGMTEAEQDYVIETVLAFRLRS